MSSRALRKLQRERGLTLGVPVSSDEIENDDDGVDPSDESGISEAKDLRTVKALNPFDLLNDEEELNENDDPSEVSSNSAASRNRKAKRKKKKSKAAKSSTDCAKPAEAVTAGYDEDDIEASVRAVNEMLGSLPQSVSADTARSSGNVEGNTKSLLFVEHRCLNPDNEIRRLFGTRVMQMDQNQRRARNQHRARSTFLARPRDHWQIHRKTGLSMQLINSSHGLNVFVFEHNKSYQKIQFEFLDAVESLEPQNIVNLVNDYPFHVDTLLQVSEIYKMSDDRQAAAEMIERALFVFENSFHPLFSLTQGTSRLEYRRAENRSFFLALWRHMITIGRKGCYRTALEYCKLILSLDPDTDPLCILLIIDFYAVRAEQFAYLIRMYDEWESHRNLSQLPNFAFSVPLAMFHQANADGTDLRLANEKLQTALLMFPGLLMPLVEKCGIAVDQSVKKCEYFNSTERELDSLKQLEMLYVGRCESSWKEPPVMAWLETNVRALVERLGNGAIDSNLLQQYAHYRRTRYARSPRNVCRHIVLSEIKEATAALPPEITLSPILSYDPLPPLDSIAAYTRPQRPTRAQVGSNPLAMFFRSLVPNFNPMEPLPPDTDADEAAPGAVGGANMRQSIAALMDVMRDMLNNIRLVPPPVENPQEQQDGEVDDDEWDD